MQLYIVDAFTDQLFSGNPAAVCPMESWPSDTLMQQIAFENNMPDTAFMVKGGSHYNIRWYTPKMEVDLCGHATLAAAHVLVNHLDCTDREILFNSRSGPLRVLVDHSSLTLDFPADIFAPVPLSGQLLRCFATPPVEAFKGKTDYLFIYESQDAIEQALPDPDTILLQDCRGIIITAPGRETDFVSRFFGPRTGVNEDPVTGSAHTTLTPYWAKALGKSTLSAIQLSERRGHLQCTLQNDRVLISGNAVTYSIGNILI